MDLDSMNTKSIHQEDCEDYEDYDYFYFPRARSHTFTLTVSKPWEVERQHYYRNKARIAASRISSQPRQHHYHHILTESPEVTSGSQRFRTSSFSSYFLPSSSPKSKPRMESTEEFWNRYRRQPRIHSFGSVVRQMLFPVHRN